MTSIEDAYMLDVPEATALAVWRFLENGSPPVRVKTGQSYTDQVMLQLNEIMGGQGVEKILVNGEVLAQYIKGFEVTVVYDERSGGYWTMRPEDWRAI